MTTTMAVLVALCAGLVLGWLARGRGHEESWLDVDSKERKQMWIREGRL